MTPVDLEAARKVAREVMERAGLASPGPWFDAGYKDTDGDGPHVETEDGGYRVAVCGILPPEHKENGKFIAAARSDVPELAGLVLAMAEELEAARQRAAVGEIGGAAPTGDSEGTCDCDCPFCPRPRDYQEAP